MDRPAGIRASWRRLLYRYVAGALVGNTWALSRADYSDLKSGEPIGTRTYDTSPSAWEGIASAMTQNRYRRLPSR